MGKSPTIREGNNNANRKQANKYGTLQAQTVKRIHWIKEKKFKEGNTELNDNNSIFTHVLLFSLIQIDIHFPHFVAKRGGLFFLSLLLVPTHSTHKAQSHTHTTKENGSERPKTSDRYFIKYYMQHNANNSHIFKSS